MRHCIVRGLVEGVEWVAALRRAYEQEGISKELADMLNPNLLTTTLFHRSTLFFPSSIKDTFIKALGFEELRQDWEEAYRWQKDVF